MDTPASRPPERSLAVAFRSLLKTHPELASYTDQRTWELEECFGAGSQEANPDVRGAVEAFRVNEVASARVAAMPSTFYRLKSRILGNERVISVGLPAAEPRALAVFLDGEFYTARIGAPGILRTLEERGEVLPTLAVFVGMVSPEVRVRECTSPRTFGRFFEEELLPSLGRRYSIIRDVGERVLVGVSLSGLAAAQAAVETPGVFTKVIAQSGSFWLDDCRLPRRVASEPAPAESILVKVYLDVGSEETETGVRHRADLLQEVSQLEGVQRLRDALKAKGYPVNYVEFAGGHAFSSWARALPGALTWAFPAPPRL